MKGKRKTWFKLWVVYVMGFINTALMHYSIHLQAIFIIGLLIIYIIRIRYIWSDLKKKSIIFQIGVYIGEIGFMLLNIVFSLANAGPGYIADFRIAFLSTLLLLPSAIFHFVSA